MKINQRTKNGWLPKMRHNKDKYVCDICKSKLWVAPDNKTVYCNNKHNI